MGSLESTGESRISSKVSEHSLLAEFSLPQGSDSRVKIRWEHMPFSHNHSTGGILPKLEIADGGGTDKVGNTKGNIDHCRVFSPSAATKTTFDDIKAEHESIDLTYTGMQKIFDKNIGKYSLGLPGAGLSEEDVNKIADDQTLTPFEKLDANFLKDHFAQIKNPLDSQVHALDLQKWDISLSGSATIIAGSDAEDVYYDHRLQEVSAGFDKAKLIGDNSLESPWTDADKIKEALKRSDLSPEEARGLTYLNDHRSEFQAMDGLIYAKNFPQWRADKKLQTGLDVAAALAKLDDCLKEYN